MATAPHDWQLERQGWASSRARGTPSSGQKKAQRRMCEGNGTILCGHHEGHKGPTTQMLESDDDVQRWRWAAMRRVQKPNAVRSAAWGYAIAAWGYAYTAWGYAFAAGRCCYAALRCVGSNAQ